MSEQSTPSHLYASARIAESQARNLMGKLTDGKIPASEHGAARAQRDGLYAKARELRGAADEAGGAL
jgi:hypothetical protein